MSKEFEELQRLAEEDGKKDRARLKDSYQYARSLGFSAHMARRLVGSSKERILRLSKELNK